MTRKEMTKMTQGPRPRCTASLGASTLGTVLTTVAVDRTLEEYYYSKIEPPSRCQGALTMRKARVLMPVVLAWPNWIGLLRPL